MKLLILCCEGLDFKRLYNPKKNDLFYKSMINQGCNFLNFRYDSPSPLPLDRIISPIRNIFKDNLYVLNNEYRQGKLLLDFKSDKQLLEIIDGRNLSINEEKGTHLAFINKNNSSLWTLNILHLLNQDYGE